MSFSFDAYIFLPASSQQIKTNKFVFENNNFQENYSGVQTSVVEIRGIRSIEIINDKYLSNLGQFKESLNKYGSISSLGENNLIDNFIPGAWSMYSYYGNVGFNNTIQELVDVDIRQNLYPIAPLLIDGAFKINVTGVVFDNNGFQELDQILVTNYYPSNAITIMRSQGIWYLNSITIQNYKGLDAYILNQILGEENSSNLYVYNPTERDKNGIPFNNITYPSYVIDYGFKNLIIKFANPQSTTGNNFQNYFDFIGMDSLIVNNITQFDPIKETAMLLDIIDDWTNLNITNFYISNVDLIEAQTSIFVLRNYGNLFIQNGVIKNLNLNAFNYDKINYSYVGDNGGTFSFYSVPVFNEKQTLYYVVNNVTFDTLYNLKGGAVFFSTKDNGADFQPNSITIVNSTIKNSFSYTNGIISLFDGGQDVIIENWVFINNTGGTAEADLRIFSSNSLLVRNVTFTLFNSQSQNFGQSITFALNLPFTFIVEFDMINLKCSNTPFNFENYVDILNSNSLLLSQSPILLNSGYLVISNSTFSNWITANKGGVILVVSGSTLIDYGSTFQNNLASLGGAIYVSQSSINLTNTILFNNYAINGGAMMVDSKSSTFNLIGVNCSNNFVTNTGSALYIIGTSSSSVSYSVFSFNTALEGNTISLLFSPTILTGITFKNNNANAESTGIFINFSVVLIQNCLFNTTIFPNGQSSLKNAAISSNLFGWFISISAGANVTIQNSTFQNGYAIYGGFIYIAGNSQIFISNSSFK